MPYVPTFGAGDAVAAQGISNLKVLYDWAVTYSQTGKLMISEIGIPGSSNPGTDPIVGSGTGATYAPQWEPTLAQVLNAMDQWGFHWTAWNASEWNVDLRAYRTHDAGNGPLDYMTTVGTVLELFYATTSKLKGVNYAGGEFADQGPNGVVNRGSVSQPGAAYYYPDSRSFAILAGRGVKLIRLPIRWERVQPTLKGNLDPVEMAMLDTVMTAANAAGIKVLLDVHNYGRYDTIATGTSGGVYDLGQAAPSTHRGATVGGTMYSCFNDLWTRLATYFKGNAAIWGYDICNEPHDLTGGVGSWQEASRQAVEAIRAVEYSAPASTPVNIAVEGYSYSTTANWTSTNGAPWLTSTIPTGQTGAGSARNTDAKIVWNGHLYLDPRTNGLDGGYQDTYANELSYAISQGFASWSTVGYTNPTINNSSQSGLRLQYAADLSSQTNAGGTYDPSTNPNGATIASGNTLTFGMVRAGSTDNAMKLTQSATSNETGLRRSLTTALSRIHEIVYEVDPSTPVSISLVSAISHLWRDNNMDDLGYDIGVQGSGSGFIVGLKRTDAPYTFVPSSTPTVLARGTRYKIKLEVTNSALNIYVAPLAGTYPGTPEATIAGSYSGVNIGGTSDGKFYGTDTFTSYYYVITDSVSATYYAPPSGGLIYTPPTGGGGPAPTHVGAATLLGIG